jgi:1-acyl-sn-glycerol-3-phosphate acyltransferase
LSNQRHLVWVSRAVRLGGHLVTGAALAVGVSLLALLHAPRPWLPGLVLWWHRRLTRCLSLEVKCRGVPVAGALVAANHVSWLDIPALGAVAPVRFVSKAEVRRWPLVGWMASLAGTLFLERGAHQALAMARSIAMQLADGVSVVVFPEGTTGDGHRLRRFHARLFAAAEQQWVPVQPVAIRYGHDVDPDSTAPFLGDDTLLAHLWRVLRHPGLAVTITFLPPLELMQPSRRQLAEAARTAIARQLFRQADEASVARAGQPEQRPATAGA